MPHSSEPVTELEACIIRALEMPDSAWEVPMWRGSLECEPLQPEAASLATFNPTAHFFCRSLPLGSFSMPAWEPFVGGPWVSEQHRISRAEVYSPCVAVSCSGALAFQVTCGSRVWCGFCLLAWAWHRHAAQLLTRSPKPYRQKDCATQYDGNMWM